MIPPALAVPTSRLTSQSYSQAVNIFFKFVIYFRGGLWFNLPMMNDVQETLFKVKIALWRKNDAFRETHIRAYDLDHAKRISNAKFGTLGVTVEPAEPFPRFDAKKIGEFNR
tara:strand:- start:697 stop:1032 length:336 start_codon:yes stop_codon:yes gene_type:complete